MSPCITCTTGGTSYTGNTRLPLCSSLASSTCLPLPTRKSSNPGKAGNTLGTRHTGYTYRPSLPLWSLQACSTLCTGATSSTCLSLGASGTLTPLKTV